MTNKVSCSCEKCVNLCEKNPGWMTPKEARAAIKAGLIGRLMCDWLEPGDELGNNERIYVLAPASMNCEGTSAPEFSIFDLLFGPSGLVFKGQCTFLRDGLCEVHDTPYKPKQCREAYGCKPLSGPDNYEMAKLWNSEDGHRVVATFWEAAR